MNDNNTSDPFSKANIQKADAFLAQFIDIKQLLPIKEGLTKEMIEYFNQFKFSTQAQIGPLTYQERQKNLKIQTKILDSFLKRTIMIIEQKGINSIEREREVCFKQK